MNYRTTGDGMKRDGIVMWAGVLIGVMMAAAWAYGQDEKPKEKKPPVKIDLPLGEPEKKGGLLGDDAPGTKPSTGTTPGRPGKSSGDAPPVTKPKSKWEPVSSDDPAVRKLNDRIAELERASKRRDKPSDKKRTLDAVRERKKKLDAQAERLEREITDADRVLTNDLATKLDELKKLKSELDKMRDDKGKLPTGDPEKIRRMLELESKIHRLEGEVDGELFDLQRKRAKQLEELKKRQERLRQLIASAELYPDQVSLDELDAAVRALEKSIIDRRTQDLRNRRDELKGKGASTPDPLNKRAIQKTGMVLADALAAAFRELDTVGSSSIVPKAPPTKVNLPLGEESVPEDKEADRRRELERELSRLREKIQRQIDRQRRKDQAEYLDYARKLLEEARRLFPNDQEGQDLYLADKLSRKRADLKKKREQKKYEDIDKYRKLKKELSTLSPPKPAPPGE